MKLQYWGRRGDTQRCSKKLNSFLQRHSTPDHAWQTPITAFFISSLQKHGSSRDHPPPATFTHTDRLSDLRLIPKPFLFITPFMAYQDCVKMSFSLCKAGEELMEAIKKG